ncbi:MAG: peptide deformylase [Puniceicoccales bacterium]|jgi:peptide deformylase|nr:peptide deformylase [Puniceicoccales bacterium]
MSEQHREGPSVAQGVARAKSWNFAPPVGDLVTKELMTQQLAEFLGNSENFTIKKIGESCLRRISVPVDDVTDVIWQKLRDEMLKKLLQAGGIGIAAPQVGVNARCCIVDLPPCVGIGDVNVLRFNGRNLLHEKKMLPRLFMLNPQITEKSTQLRGLPEGCLSVPERRAGDVMRPWQVTVEFFDCDGKKNVVIADGYAGRCCQHEIDHLDGILYVDYLQNL